GRQISHAFELYEALIDSWLERESSWVNKAVLQDFSEYLAVDLYVNRARRGAEKMPSSELTTLAASQGIPLHNWQLTGRSLLNRDAAGNYKFAHRSIMEFLFVKRYLAADRSTWVSPWTDKMSDFLAEIINSRKWVELAPKIDLGQALYRIKAQPSLTVMPYLTRDSSEQPYRVRLRLYLIADNPNEFPIHLKGADLRFSIGDHRSKFMMPTQNLTFDKGATGRPQKPVVMLERVLESISWSYTAPHDAVKYSLAGNLTFESPVGPFSIPVTTASPIKSALSLPDT
ncbi:MAG TPA: hypothetical protein VFR03_19395, partial [Thermoanaerobaculia bacterium]|nr:hypothetical protein [Thermoanaerobaculia bacterium]